MPKVKSVKTWHKAADGRAVAADDPAAAFLLVCAGSEIDPLELLAAGLLPDGSDYLSEAEPGPPPTPVEQIEPAQASASASAVSTAPPTPARKGAKK